MNGNKAGNTASANGSGKVGWGGVINKWSAMVVAGAVGENNPTNTCLQVRRNNKWWWRVSKVENTMKSVTPGMAQNVMVRVAHHWVWWWLVCASGLAQPMG